MQHDRPRPARSLEDLRGRRAARWIRESTAGQADNFGPDAQAEQQTRAIERWGLVDTGGAWEVAHSGRTIAATGQWAEMLAGAGEDWEVLVVGYVSRFARDLRTAVNARHDLQRLTRASLNERRPGPPLQVTRATTTAPSKVGAETTAQLVWILGPRLPGPDGMAETDDHSGPVDGAPPPGGAKWSGDDCMALDSEPDARTLPATRRLGWPIR